MKMAVGHMHGEPNLCEFNEQKDLMFSSALYNFPIGVPATDFIIFSFGVHMLTVNSNILLFVDICGIII